MNSATLANAVRSNGGQPETSWRQFVPWLRRELGYRTQNERRKQSDRKQKPRQTADGIWTNWRSAEKRLGIRLRRTSRNASQTNTTRRSACWSTCVIWQFASSVSQNFSLRWRSSAKRTLPKGAFCAG